MDIQTDYHYRVLEAAGWGEGRVFLGLLHEEGAEGVSIYIQLVIAIKSFWHSEYPQVLEEVKWGGEGSGRGVGRVEWGIETGE